MHLVLSGEKGGGREDGGAEDLRTGGVGWGVVEEKAFHEVMAHFKKIPLCFLSPIPIRRWAFLSHLQRRGGK